MQKYSEYVVLDMGGTLNKLCFLSTQEPITIPHIPILTSTPLFIQLNFRIVAFTLTTSIQSPVAFNSSMSTFEMIPVIQPSQLLEEAPSSIRHSFKILEKRSSMSNSLKA